MSYASSGVITSADYNTLAFNGSNVGDQWGVGTGNHGLGQNTSPITVVSSSLPVTAVQWTGLIQTINSCLAHEGQSVITPAGVTIGNVITYYNSITSGSASAYTNSGTTGLSLSDASLVTQIYNGAWGTTGSRSLVFINSVTFTSGDAARYFFNAGGRIKLSCARSGGSVTTRNTDWSALATACGSIQFGYNNTTKVDGSGMTAILLNSNNGGYWAGTGAYVTHFKQFDASLGYTNDYISIDYYWSGTVANGGYPVLNIRTTWMNAHVQTYQDPVDGAASVSLVVSPPATTYLTNTWGTPTADGSVTPV